VERPDLLLQVLNVPLPLVKHACQGLCVSIKDGR
jgi:hypothetical protein